MVNTKKFSEFTEASLDNSDLESVGLENGINIKTPKYPTWTTVGRPASPYNGLLGYNTTLQQYEFWDAVALVWTQLEDSTDIAALLALLASHTAGEGASLIGLENQGGVNNKTVQDMSEERFIVQTNSGSLLNAQALGSLASGFMTSLTATGVVSNRTLTGTANQIDLTNGTGASGNPVFSLSATLDTPGTFTILNSVVLDEIIDDDTMATATDSNVPTSESIVAYISSVIGGAAGGANGNIQYNNLGAFGGDANFNTDGAGNIDIVGSLDVDNININGNTISSTNVNGNLLLTPNGSGNLVLDGLNWPQADGATNTFLYTNGAGQIGFTTAAYPLTSGALGNVLKSDGTNWVSGADTPGALTQDHIYVGDASNVAQDVAMSGDATIVAGGALTIANGAITNAKVNASAAIDFSKLAALTSGNILVGSAGNVATSVTMSGDATIIASGALTIANSAVTNAKMANMADQTIKGNVSGGSAAPSDLTKAQVLTFLGSTFNQVNVQHVTTTGAGTYTPTSGMKYVIVCAQAGGGGAGGAATTGAAAGAGGAGGGGGEYIEALFTAAQVGASKAYSVGAKGNGGSAGNNAGAAGSNTTFNTTWIVATGGGAGSGCPSTAGVGWINTGSGGGGTGGSVATGTLIKQASGMYGAYSLQVIAGNANGGAGGSAGCGAGGAAQTISSSTAGVAAPTNSGAGGSGASTNNGSQQAGGNGGDGFITFIEFISG